MVRIFLASLIVIANNFVMAEENASDNFSPILDYKSAGLSREQYSDGVISFGSCMIDSIEFYGERYVHKPHEVKSSGGSKTIVNLARVSCIDIFREINPDLMPIAIILANKEDLMLKAHKYVKAKYGNIFDQ